MNTRFSLSSSPLHNEKEQHATEVNNAALPLSSAVRTGLEPATSGVTGRHSNLLNYRTKITLWELLPGFLPVCECKVTTFFSFPQIFSDIFQKKSLSLRFHLFTVLRT